MDQSLFKYEIVAEDPKTHARAGILHTPHGDIETPIFMPVGTVGSVKAIAPDDLDAMGLGVPDSVRLAIRLRNAGYDIPETVTDVEALAEAILRNISRGSDADA